MSDQATARRGKRTTMTHKMWRLGTVLALTASSLLAVAVPGSALPPGAPKVGMVCTPGTVNGSTHTFNLETKTGYIETPDGNSVFMWSYDDPTVDAGHFQSPGPVLCATQGQTITVNLTNHLTEATSLVFPGQQGMTASGGAADGLLAREAAAAGGTVSYTFTAASPGTYLYESGSDVAKQVEMGLYGALIIRPSAANTAYGDVATQFDPSREYLMLLADMDPFLHHAVETGTTYDFNSRDNRYFTINGRSFPDTIQDNGSGLLPNQPYGALVRIRPTNSTASTLPALIRMVNAGVDNHPFHPHGNHTTQIAQDGRQLTSPGGAPAFTEHFGETIGAGATEDFLLRWDDTDHWDPGTNPLPVPPPNYRDVTFKDANTWYSGSPYLGYKGTLPAGTTSQNICGEWYFPWHSHALNEFTNFDEGFGGMGTLLRVDPPGGCFTTAFSTAIVGGVLKSGSVSALAVGGTDTNYYQVNPRTTTRPTATTAAQPSITVASAAGFPTSGNYYIRIDNEVMQVTGGQGTTTWTVARGQLGTVAASHLSGATISALANDWYGSFSGVKAGSTNLKVIYQGKNCGNTTGAACTAISTNLPQQTVKICNWTVPGAAGCNTAASPGWVTLPAPPSQPQDVGSTDVSSTWTPTGLASQYIGTGTYNGQVKVLIHTQRWTAPSPTAFSTWGNLLALTYDAP
jgi:hypothetical protein